MKKHTNDYKTASALLKGTSVSLTDAARLVLEMLEAAGAGGELRREDALAHCRRMARLGKEALQRECDTVPFRQAVEETLCAKAHRAERTRADIRYYMRRLMRETPGLADRPLRAMTSGECAAMLERVFPTAPQRRKARAILSGVFTAMRRRRLCGENPVRDIEIPTVREQEIVPLSLPEVRRLLRTAQSPEHRDCLPAVALMLYAGVRPDEVRRLTWQDIDREEHEVIIRARHSKTGGGRHVALCPAAQRLLERGVPSAQTTPICPRNWRMRWRRLRRCAGFRTWTPDVLRHTYASYHLKNFRDVDALQISMGHATPSLLFTRYVNLRGVTRRSAKTFWRVNSPLTDVTSISVATVQ